MNSPLFSLSGTVHKHLGRGARLGYPTANIAVSPDSPEGIFIGYTTFNEVKYPALIFIGAPITFGETDKKAEIYILDLSQDLYGSFLAVDVFQKIRDNEKFNSKEELIAQLKKDEAQARAYFRYHGK